MFIITSTFGMDREELKNAKSFLETKEFEGAQVAYSWRQLEQGKDNYDFGLIHEDGVAINLISEAGGPQFARPPNSDGTLGRIDSHDAAIELFPKRREQLDSCSRVETAGTASGQVR